MPRDGVPAVVREGDERVVAAGHVPDGGPVGVVQDPLEAVVVRLAGPAVGAGEAQRGDHLGQVPLDVRVRPEEHVLTRVDVGGAGRVERRAPRLRNGTAGAVGLAGVEVQVEEAGVQLAREPRRLLEGRAAGDGPLQGPLEVGVDRREGCSVVAAQFVPYRFQGAARVLYAAEDRPLTGQVPGPGGVAARRRRRRPGWRRSG
ncbi:hypothetical protein J116_027435 [Streptomyces thermolilacinus SPC6]|uniref:Uncharacterized protein n=1 Tax=Streptomyces thermolilacinus SPC6 TaxID=1306406 RepID=A0A1D3DZ84_9ACTN|nr:hypothetical protein J116_027435 [Streptomyces thermolilacinus SPC6]